MSSAAYDQYKFLLEQYVKVLPASTFPYIPLVVAAIFQVVAWFGGKFLGHLVIVPRIFVLWLFALGEYSFMSPTMNAATEILKLPESYLVVIYQVITLCVFIIMDITVFKNKLKLKHIIAYILIAIAIYIVHMW